MKSDNKPDFYYIENFFVRIYRRKYWNKWNVSLLDPNNEVKIFFDNNLLDDPIVGYPGSRGDALFLS